MAVKAIVLGAGKGKRMKSDMAKVLHSVAGRPLLGWVLDAVAATECDQTVVVVGHQADAVRSILPAGVGWALQAEQLGTGHAAVIGLSSLDVGPEDDVIVLPGDMPLVRGETLNALIALHRESGAVATMLTVELEDPAAYGRVIRGHGSVLAVVEVKDATPEQLAVSEVNTSVYVFSGRRLPGLLSRLTTENAQQEYYLTEAIEILVDDGDRVEAYITDPEEGFGVNSVEQLAEVEAILIARG